MVVEFKCPEDHLIIVTELESKGEDFLCMKCNTRYHKSRLTSADPHAAKRDILNSALAAVCGDRALNYGKPEANFARIALLWNAYVHIRAKDQGVEEAKLAFTEWDVANLMILMKVARTMNQPNHKDSWVDIAGYAACAYDITHDMK